MDRAIDTQKIKINPALHHLPRVILPVPTHDGPGGEIHLTHRPSAQVIDRQGTRTMGWGEIETNDVIRSQIGRKGVGTRQIG